MNMRAVLRTKLLSETDFARITESSCNSVVTSKSKTYMKKLPLFSLSLCCAALALTGKAYSQTVYSENFDLDATANWTVNNNGNGVNAANFFFDYSALGISAAPHSTGGSTIGLKLSANISGTGPASGVLPGLSVSPTGQGFTGNYTLRFDWWHNWLGAASGGIGASAGGSGSTQLSTFGLLTSGTSANYAGASDSVFFAATGDGASAADFRAYSAAKQSGYAPSDAGITYAAGSQNNTASLYTTLFPAGATAPAAQTAIASTQSGLTLAGTAGFRWHDVEITKMDNLITWTINGTLVATLDATGLTTGGDNILFGMADTSLGAGTPASLFSQLDFTLIDNVTVSLIPEPSSLALVGLGGLALLARRRK